MQTTAVALNGRFLAAPATGVQRVAEELIKQLDILLEDRPSGIRWTLYAPRNAKRYLTLKNISVHYGQRSAISWEQFELPWYSRGAVSIDNITSRPEGEVRKILTLPWIIKKIPRHGSPSQNSISSAANFFSTAR